MPGKGSALEGECDPSGEVTSAVLHVAGHGTPTIPGYFFDLE